MSASHYRFDHRVHHQIGSISDLPTRGRTHAILNFKTDTGRLLRVVRVLGEAGLFEVIDDQSGLRARVELDRLFERIATDVLEAAPKGSAPSNTDNQAITGEAL